MTRSRLVTGDGDATRENREDEKRAAILESSLDAIVAIEQTGEIFEWNPCAERTFGHTRAEALGRSLPELVIPDRLREEHVAGLVAYLATGAGPLVGKRTEVAMMRRDGSEFAAEISLARIGTLEPAAFVGFIRDISARVRAEAELLDRSRENAALEVQLRQAQKMEAVGRLAGGVAHDFNNLLSVVMVSSEILLADLPPADPLREEAEAIHLASSRAADLTRQLLTFSRHQVCAPRVLDLNEVLVQMDPMLRRLLGEEVELVSLPRADRARVRMDPGSIEQIIVNLAINARDAIGSGEAIAPGGSGGRLTMETSSVVHDEEYARVHLGVAPGPYVVLTVTDSGCGMDEATMARIFEPFFTTKEKGKGTGLGLSTVFGIVQRGGGHVSVGSDGRSGSTFIVLFPSVDAAVEPVGGQVNGQVNGQDDDSRVPARPRTSETILLVEDEDQVRAAAASILRRHGYTVLIARAAAEAIALFEASGSGVHLLLTDVVMPQMSGSALAQRLLLLRPSLKVLCMSGYTEDASLRPGEARTAFSFLQKPFTVETLTHKVRETLDDSRIGQPVTRML